MTQEVVRMAAIDIGTVTTRLLIADVGPESLTEVARSTDITHFGEGLAESQSLSAEAIARVADVLGAYSAKIAEAGAHKIIAIATSAARDAVNAAAFMSAVNASGVAVSIISGAREAYLSFAGATWQLGGSRILLNDIGGGSTELVYGRGGLPHDGDGPVIERAMSIDVGSRRVTEMFFRTDPPTPKELKAARDMIASEIGRFFKDTPARPETLVSVAGTATSLSAMNLQMAQYDPVRIHGSILTRAEVSAMLKRLSAMSVESRKGIVGLHPARAPVIVAGTMVLDCVMELSGLDFTIVSEHDILYGILLDAYAAEKDRFGLAGV